MPDFSRLLSHTALEAPPPPDFPDGVYRGVIKSIKQSKQNTQTGVAPVINIEAGLIDWPEEVEDEIKQSIRLNGRTVTKTYFLNAEEIEAGNLQSFYNIDQLIRSCGIAGANRAYAEVLPELVGADVSVRMKKRTYEDKQTGKMKESTNVSAIWGDHTNE